MTRPVINTAASKKRKKSKSLAYSEKKKSLHSAAMLKKKAGRSLSVPQFSCKLNVVKLNYVKLFKQTTLYEADKSHFLFISIY